jgi:eukaryotic-like serine/threonine-protein kinase
MLRGENRALADLAASVADGAQIDWSSVEARAEAPDRRLVRHLRLVESIAVLHRSISVETEADRVPVTPAPSGQKWGRLILLDRIGEGTSCEVFKAWDTELHRNVALKLLHQDDDRDAHKRVLEEARRMARVRHQHVVQVYGAETHDGRVGLWMELVRGESLEQILKDRGPFGARETAAVGLDLCAALAAVHRAHLLHRDIKAQNVMREEGGRIVLMDFGTGEELSGTNRLVGTPLYLAPEIFDGQKASVQSDVYSLGVLLFYLLTGAYPVTAATMEQLARAHLRRDRKSLRDLRPDLPQNLVQTVERAMAFEAGQRFRSAGDMERALQEAIDVAAAPLVAAPVPVPVRRRQFGAMFVAAAVALIACVVGLTWWARTVQARRGETLAAVRSIAVMPTEHDPSSQVSDQFVRGFTDELLATFGQIQALTVKPGVGSGGAGRTSQEIARVLDVDALLTTTLSSDDGARDGTAPLVVRAQLVAAGTGAVIWTGRVERPRGDSQRLQNELALAIASAVLPGKNVAVPPQRTTNPEAEVAYLLGRSHLDRYGAGSADLALKAFERARDIDPSHAAALVGAARARISMGLNGAIPHQQARTQALADVHKALAIDPNLAEGYATLAHISFIYDWNFQLAERNFQKALELNPSQSYARIYYAELLSALHRFDESIEQIELGRRLEPESAALVRRHALLDYYRGDFAAAERTLAVAVAMEPGSAGGPLLQGRIYEATGRVVEALASTRRAASLTTGTIVPMRVQLVCLEARTGDIAAARASYQALQTELAARAIQLTSRDRAYIEHAFGNDDASLALFGRAIEERDPSVVWLGVDARLADMRTDSRFQKLLAAIGLQ